MEDFTDIEEIRDMQETNEQDIEYDKIFIKINNDEKKKSNKANIFFT